MTGHSRRVGYAVQHYGWLPYEASAMVADPGANNADRLLTPAQRRRIKHKRSTRKEK
jgi:hypothetical protein